MFFIKNILRACIILLVLGFPEVYAYEYLPTHHVRELGYGKISPQILSEESCITGSEEFSSGEKSYLTFNRGKVVSESLTSIEGVISGEANAVVASGQAESRFLLSKSPHKLKESYLIQFIAQTGSKKLKLDSIQLSDFAQRALESGDFYERCGTQFIYETRRFIKFYLALEVEYENYEEKKEFSSSIEGEFGIKGLGVSDETSGRYSSEESEDRGQVKISFLQMGGDIEYLVRNFPLRERSCSIEDRAQCLKVYQEILEYVTHDLPEMSSSLPEDAFYIGSYSTFSYKDTRLSDSIPEFKQKNKEIDLIHKQSSHLYGLLDIYENLLEIESALFYSNREFMALIDERNSQLSEFYSKLDGM